VCHVETAQRRINGWALPINEAWTTDAWDTCSDYTPNDDDINTDQ